jgi:hypothetical protein
VNRQTLTWNSRSKVKSSVVYGPFALNLPSFRDFSQGLPSSAVRVFSFDSFLPRILFPQVDGTLVGGTLGGGTLVRGAIRLIY